MTQTVNFSPSSVNIGVTEPGATSTGASQCAPIAAAANVTASITNDTSNGALTILSVASYLPVLIFRPPEPPGPSGGGMVITSNKPKSNPRLAVTKCFRGQCGSHRRSADGVLA
jgi:hypothetical protein